MRDEGTNCDQQDRKSGGETKFEKWAEKLAETAKLALHKVNGVKARAEAIGQVRKRVPANKTTKTGRQQNTHTDHTPHTKYTLHATKHTH